MPIISPHKARLRYGGGGGPLSTFQYFRLTITKIKYASNDVPPSTGDARISEMEVFAGATEYPTANYTDSTFVTTTSEAATFEAWKAFDGTSDDTHRWITNGGAAGTLPQSVTVNVQSQISPTSYNLAPDAAVASGYFPQSWTLHGSKTGAFTGEEVLLDTRTNVSTLWHPSLRRRFNLGGAPAGTAYRYWRLNITEVRSAGVIGALTTYDTRVAELQLFSKYEQSPVKPMASATDPSPYVITTSGQNGSFPAYTAFTMVVSDASRWISNTGTSFPRWIQIDLGSGNEIVVTSYKIAPDGAVSSGYHPTAFQLLASNTGAFAGEEVTIDSRSGITSGWADLTLRTFTIGS